jgi:DNA transposition AAA+ family ATPase
MKPVFCQDTVNFQNFMTSTRRVEGRGAAEAGWLLVLGEPGLGKSRAMSYYSVTQNSVFLRAKAAWTVNWMLRELVTELGEQPARRSEHLLDQAVKHFAVNAGRTLIVDEVDHAMHDIRVLESIRDISDMTEITVIIGGMRGAERKLRRHPHIYSRIADVCRFEAASLADTRAMCAALCEAEVAEDLAIELHRQAGGYFREIVNAIAEVERMAKRKKIAVIQLADMGGQRLTNDGRSTARGGA